MGHINYFSGIVKVLETPKQYFNAKQTMLTTFRVEMPQKNKNIIVYLILWGNVSKEIKNFYKQDDYILIEGYISLRNKQKLTVSQQTVKLTTITVLKVYPILLN